MKTNNNNQFANPYKSERNVALAVYVILTTSLVSAYTLIQLFQGV